MANTEQLAVLRRGVTPWNIWRLTQPATIPDLREANLQGINLFGADLRRADLSGANLTKAYIRETVLRGAILRGAILREASLSLVQLNGADLRGADLEGAGLGGSLLNGANLQGANLQGAYLNGANLQGANFQGANLEGVALHGALLDTSTEIDAKYRLIWEIVTKAAANRNLTGADLSQANLSKADLRRADLTGADLRRAKLTEAKLIGADLTGADLSGADLSRVDLSEAILRGTLLDSSTEIHARHRLIWEIVTSGGAGRNLAGAYLSRANLAGADLRRANLAGADLREANLRRADLTGANLAGADLSRANLTGADLTGADLSKAKLQEAKFQEANLTSAALHGALLDSSTEIDAKYLLIWEIVTSGGAGRDLTGADLSQANLSGVDFAGAILKETALAGADLTGAQLIGTDLTRANLTGCRIYGIAAWNLALDGTTQNNLIISAPTEPVITVDNLEVAQFIYLLLNNKKIRDVIDTITSKVVLILGRFTEERKAVLDAIREELRKLNYLPILFDFDKPASKDLTGTVETLARMARFIIADLTDPSSIPHELATIVPFLRTTPVLPLKLAGASGYSMFIDLQRAYTWVLNTYEYQDGPSLTAALPAIIAPVERLASELRTRS